MMNDIRDNITVLDASDLDLPVGSFPLFIEYANMTFRRITQIVATDGEFGGYVYRTHDTTRELHVLND